MMKLKSSLTCTTVSLLMVFFFAGVAHSNHPWAEGERPGGPEWETNPPGPRTDDETMSAKASTFVNNYSKFGLLSSVAFEISTVFVDYVYGNGAEATKINQTVDEKSSRK